MMVESHGNPNGWWSGVDHVGGADEHPDTMYSVHPAMKRDKNLRILYDYYD